MTMDCLAISLFVRDGKTIQVKKHGRCRVVFGEREINVRHADDGMPHTETYPITAVTEFWINPAPVEVGT